MVKPSAVGWTSLKSCHTAQSASQPWLQWTASPPCLADLDGDGHNEVIGVPNVEKKIPYETQSYALMVLDGGQDKGVRAAQRHAGFTTLPQTGKPAVRKDGDWYPPTGIPAPTLVDLTGDGHPDIVVPGPDGKIYATSSTGQRLWTYDYAHGASKTFASEVVAADLNHDGVPELVFGEYGLTKGKGQLDVLSATGRSLATVTLPDQVKDGNGVGIAAAPSIADIDLDGNLEIVASTIDHGIDIFRVPGSTKPATRIAGSTWLPWPTGRGNLLRTGTQPSL